MPMKKGNKEKKVYFSPSEWRKVCEKAKAANCRVGTYIRQISVEGEVRVFDLSLIAHLQKEINGIGRNINQTPMLWSRYELYSPSISSRGRTLLKCGFIPCQTEL